MKTPYWIERMKPENFLVLLGLLALVGAVLSVLVLQRIGTECAVCGEKSSHVDEYGVCKECKVKAYRTILSDTKSDGQSSLK